MQVLATRSLRRGEVFIAMHDATTNRLTRSEFDPYSRQPSYKHAAVKVEALSDA